MQAKEIMERYNFKSQQSLSKFLIKHMDEINKDGQLNLVKSAGKWILSDEGKKILDSLRHINTVSVANELASERENKLKEEIRQKDIYIMNLQQEQTTILKKYVGLEEEYRKEQIKLLPMAVKAEESEKANKLLQEEINRLKTENECLKQPWWKKIFK